MLTQAASRIEQLRNSPEAKFEEGEAAALAKAEDLVEKARKILFDAQIDPPARKIDKNLPTETAFEPPVAEPAEPIKANLRKISKSLCSKSDILKVVELLNKNGFSAKPDIRVDRGQEDVVSMETAGTHIPEEVIHLLQENGYSPSATTSSKRKNGYKIKFLVWK
jgi:hypothetical protein